VLLYGLLSLCGFSWLFLLSGWNLLFNGLFLRLSLLLLFTLWLLFGLLLDCGFGLDLSLFLFWCFELIHISLLSLSLILRLSLSQRSVLRWLSSRYRLRSSTSLGSSDTSFKVETTIVIIRDNLNTSRFLLLSTGFSVLLFWFSQKKWLILLLLLSMWLLLIGLSTFLTLRDLLLLTWMLRLVLLYLSLFFLDNFEFIIFSLCLFGIDRLWLNDILFSFCGIFILITEKLEVVTFMFLTLIVLLDLSLNLSLNATFLELIMLFMMISSLSSKGVSFEIDRSSHCCTEQIAQRLLTELLS
jgi:hypothetical protein